MIRDVAMRVAQRGDRSFRWRGAEVSRVETLFDAVIALAMTLVIVSLEVPEKFDDLAESFRRLPAFAACFFILVMFWHYHFIFHRRYGLEDIPTIGLNAIVVFLVLLYVYPMKFLYSALLDRRHVVMQNEDYPTLMRMFSWGWISIFVVFTSMYLYAYHRRKALELNAAERWITLQEISAHSLHVLIGVISIVVTRCGRELLPFAGLVYVLVGPVQGLNGWLFGRQLDKKAEAAAKLGESQSSEDR